jgi:hypothetical protein
LNGSAKHRYAAVAGALCAGVSLCTLASSLALDAAPAMTAIGLAAFGLLLSFLCFAVPWERASRWTIDLAPGAAILGIAIATTTIDPTYGFYLVLVAACVAYMVSRPAVVGLHLGLIGLALVAPIVFEPDGARTAVASALIFGPGVIAASAIAVYMRRTSDAREAAYRDFANDAMALAARIRSRAGAPVGSSLRAPEWLEAPAPVIPLRNVGIAKVVRIKGLNGSGAASASRRLPMTAIAIAASVVAVVATTTALVREPGDRVVVTKGSPAVAEDAVPRTIAARPADDGRQTSGRHRIHATGPATESAVSQPPLALTDPSEPAGSGGGNAGAQQPSTPAASPPPETTVPVRPQTGDPQPDEPPPTPVQQAGPGGPVASAVGLVEQTVDPLTPDLKP